MTKAIGVSFLIMKQNDEENVYMSHRVTVKVIALTLLRVRVKE